jgi:hypothetical protein
MESKKKKSKKGFASKIADAFLSPTDQQLLSSIGSVFDPLFAQDTNASSGVKSYPTPERLRPVPIEQNEFASNEPSILSKINEYTPWQQAKEIRELQSSVADYVKQVKDNSKKLGEEESAVKTFGKGVDALGESVASSRIGNQEALANIKAQNASLESMKQKGAIALSEADSMHQANLAQQAKWAQDKEQAVQARVDSVSSQARHPWEPKTSISPIVKTKEQSIADMDKEIDAMAKQSLAVKKPAPTILKPRVAEGQEEIAPSMAATKQERPSNYADEYKRRYAAALAGSAPSTGGLM